MMLDLGVFVQKETKHYLVNREDADEFVEKYSNPHIYDSPYASLECGILRVEELNMTPPDREDMWWLD